MTKLSEKTCVPCRGGFPPLTTQEIMPLADQLTEWKVIENHHLEKSYQFANFKDALDFVNTVGEIAEAQAHHPDLSLAWGKVTITIWSHKIKGLSESDFILAAKIDCTNTTHSSAQ